MTKLILSTGNVTSAGPSIVRKSGAATRSNLELVNSLRENMAAARKDFPSPDPSLSSPSSSMPPPPPPLAAWVQREDQTVYIPRIDWQAAGLRDEPAQYEITVKLFLMAGTPVAERADYVREALDLVSRELGVKTIDLLVVSFPGMSFEGSCEWEADKINARQGNLEEEIATWKVFENLHRKGIAKRLGVAEFGGEKLGAFIKRTSVPPSVDQVNLQNCCIVPPPLKKISEETGIELNVHIDCTNILPSGTLRELLGQGPNGAGLLADAADDSPGLRGEIVPQWVVRYMAFVRDRGVIENKGYFAGAQLVEP